LRSGHTSARTGWDPGRIADQLNTEGFLPARGAGPIRHRLVTQILHRTGAPITHRRQPLPAHPDDAPGKHEWWLPLLAAELGVTTGTIRKWLHQGRITGRQETRPPHRWIIHADPGALAGLRAHIDRVRGRTESPRRVRRLDLLGECPAWDEQRRTTRVS
jgi:hypothetical protein